MRDIWTVFTRILILGILFSGFLPGCGPGVRIYSDVEDEGRFDQYKTYSFLEFTEGNKKTITGMELERIRIAIAREIELRGLSFVEKEGDVSVQITLYHRQAMDNYYYSPRRYNYMERALAVDMYDNLLRKHVWHGAAVGELAYDPSSRTEELPVVVTKIFERYPVEAPTYN
ncbi:MAG: DUF4136 domain-containing protein [Bacteroidota bacterium]